MVKTRLSREWLLVVFTLFFFIFPLNVFARVNNHSYQGNWYLSASAGATQLSLPGSTLVSNGTGSVPPFQNDKYWIEQPGIGGMFALGGGYRWQANRVFIPSFSLGFQYSRLVFDKISGELDQFGLPTFRNYNYSFDFDANLYTLVGKIDLVQIYRVLPYVAIGMGAGYSRLGNFGESAKPGVTSRTSTDYASNDNINFIYTLGGGFDINCTDKILLTVGYEYEDLGNITSGEGTGPWASTKIKLGELKNNLIFVGLTYQFLNAS